jgi:hypothetical protein
MAIKELFYDNRPEILIDPRASQRIDPRFKYTRNSFASYWDQDGILRVLETPPNVPRFEYEPNSREYRGFLFEEQRTSIARGSEDFDSSWLKVAATVVPNALQAPDGNLTADVATNTPGALSRISRIFLLGLSKTYAISVFVKYISGVSQLVAFEIGGIGYTTFNIVNNTTGGSVPGFVESYPNGWKRITSVATTLATGTPQLNAIYLGNYGPGQAIEVGFWGLQIEEGTYSSSYIRTVNADVTRAADLLSVEAPLPASGSVYIDARAIRTNQNDTLLSLKNSSNDKIDLGFFSNAATYNSLALISNYDGTSKSSLPLPVPTTNRERNIITYGSQNYQYGSNSSRFATSLSSSVPTGLNQLSIGHDAVDPTKAFNGYINSVYLWSGELTPEVAEALVRSDLDPINADTFVPTGPAGSLSIIINTQGASASGDKVFALPAESDANDNDIVITWGDGTESGLENAAAELGAAGLQKTYTAAGIYSIFVEGKLENLQFNNSASAPDLVQIVRWGTTANGNDVFLSPSTMANAFYGCSKMDFSSVAKTTNLPDTSAVQNWSQAFYNCSSITGIFPQFNFSAATNFTRAWRGCSSLTAFTAAGGQPQNVTNFTDAWYGCSGLTSFPLIDTSSGTNFSGAWYGCSGLTSFPLINTAASTSFVNTWFGCSGLTSFPLINTAACTNFSLAWRQCSSLTSFPLINTSSSTNFSNTWFSCSSLTSFPLIDTSSGRNFTSAWLNCVSLTSFPLLDTSSGIFFANAWQACLNLTSFPLIDTGAGTNFSSAWYNNDSLTAFPSLNFDSAEGLASDSSTTYTGFRETWRSCDVLADFPANRFNNTTCTRYLDAFTGCALTAASIENILVSINDANTSNGNLGIGGGNNAGASTWTAAAIAAYDDLVSRGWTITRNA